MKEKESKVIVNLYGFDIKKDTLYEVQEKFDASAPDGFQAHRTSKLMSFDIEDSCGGAIWDMSKNNWDTGLYEGSTALREAFEGSADLKIIVRNLNDYIVRPFEKEVGEGRLTHIPSDEINEFWDNYRIGLKRGKVFNTAKPKDLLDLFFCLLHRKLTPKTEESNPDFKNSYYLIVDQEGAVSRKAESEKERMKAIATFSTLLDSDRETILSILDYIGLPVGAQTNETTLIRMFNSWLDDKNDKYQNDRIFNKTVAEFSTDRGKDILYYYKLLKELKTKGTVYIKRGDVYLDGTLIVGGTLKNAAEKIYEDKEAYELFEPFIK